MPRIKNRNIFSYKFKSAKLDSIIKEWNLAPGMNGMVDRGGVFYYTEWNEIPLFTDNVYVFYGHQNDVRV